MADRPAEPGSRTCVGCRERGPRSDLLRVVAAGGVLVPDPRRRLGGRGAHLHHDSRCLALAERRRAWTRALRAPGPLDTAGLRAYLEQDTSHPDGAPPVVPPHGKAGDPNR